ncbi:MAG: hypothetical protein SP1CHLAM54_17650 [Chlamydiia bacterium]|nr:hypothetical protein [Chlamydiia bacterium]MCH9616653.1 hypothetical protein [Chlamydiia bacterium]MCH9629383.1 hypothetical protein [Chlamydiia bacterium]
MTTNVQMESAPVQGAPTTGSIETTKHAALITTLGSAVKEASGKRPPSGNAMYGAAEAMADSMDANQFTQGSGIQADELIADDIENQSQALQNIAKEAKNVPQNLDSSGEQLYLTKLGIASQRAELGLKTDYTDTSTIKTLQISAPESAILTTSALGEQVVEYNNQEGQTRPY